MKSKKCHVESRLRKVEEEGLYPKLLVHFQFCHRCVCKYETRNTAKIKVVVIIVIFVIVSIR